MYVHILCLYKRCHTCLPFLEFSQQLSSSGEPRRESSSPSDLHSTKFNKPKPAATKHWSRVLVCFLALNQMKWRPVCAALSSSLFAPLDASKMKLVALSGGAGRGLRVTLGEWKSDPENTAVCICVLRVTSSHAHRHWKTRCSSVFYC